MPTAHGAKTRRQGRISHLSGAHCVLGSARRHLTSGISFSPQGNLQGTCDHPHFTDEKTKAQRGYLHSVVSPGRGTVPGWEASQCSFSPCMQPSFRVGQRTWEGLNGGDKVRRVRRLFHCPSVTSQAVRWGLRVRHLDIRRGTWGD